MGEVTVRRGKVEMICERIDIFESEDKGNEEIEC